MLKEVVWLGDSKEVVTRFSNEARVDLGFQLYLLQ